MNKHPHRDDDHHSGTCGHDDGRLRLGRRRALPRPDPVTELRLGYFANVTHAPALVGLEEGLFEDALGDVDVTTPVFNAGPAAIEALTAGAIDATYIGPNPSINTFIQSAGESARIIAGAATGGAALVVARRDRHAGRPRGHDARDTAARQHAGCRAPQLAGG